MSRVKNKLRILDLVSEPLIIISMLGSVIVYYWIFTLPVYFFAVVLTLTSGKTATQKLQWIFIPPLCLVLVFLLFYFVSLFG